ncbi:MAG: phosphatase PAP2 family protein [Bacteroidota bacterium]
MSVPTSTFLRRRLERGAPYGLGLTVALAVVISGVVGFLLVLRSVSDASGLARLDGRAHDALIGAFGRHPDVGLALTWFGNNLTLVTLVIGVTAALLIARRPDLALRVALASGGGGIVVVSLKQLFSRQRPVDQLVPADGFSFPSGHAFASTVFYTMMVIVVWRLTENRLARAAAVVVGPLIVAMVGLTRVYLNVHYLTDVVAGWLAGLAWLALVLAVVRVAEARWRPLATAR